MNHQVLVPCEEESSTPSLTGVRFLLFPKPGIPSLQCEACPDLTADFSRKVACPLSRWCVELHGEGVVYLIHRLQRWEIRREGSGPAAELRTARRRDRYPYHWRVRNVDAEMRKKNDFSTYTDNNTTQWRCRDAWSRLIPTTATTTHGKIGVGGPWKRRIVRFKKNGFVRFYKSGLVRFEKNGLCRFEKSGFFAFKKAFCRFEKSVFFRSSNGRLRVSRSYASTRIGGSPM